MPFKIIAALFTEGIPDSPALWTVIKAIPWLALVVVLKIYFGGARSTAERNMHGKVVMLTGGTSGIGASIARDLAFRGAQIILLTRAPLSDPFLVDYIEDLRSESGNELITAETVDLSNLHSIRLFATKWVDNAPPRRLDLIVLCASTFTTQGAPVEVSDDGVENTFAVNYLANFHLLSILSPAIRAQPPDRDVRILVAACPSYHGGVIPTQIPTPRVALGATSTGKIKEPKTKAVVHDSAKAFASSKLSLMTFAAAFQKHLSSYSRPDKSPMTAHVLLVDPGWSRTPGMRRWLTGGSLWVLVLYLLTWPVWWLVLKSSVQGGQSFLWATLYEEFFRRSLAGETKIRLVKECREVSFGRSEIEDEAKQKQLWELSEKAIEALEKEAAIRRKRQKEEADEAKRKEEKLKDAGPQPGSRKSKKAEKATAGTTKE